MSMSVTWPESLYPPAFLIAFSKMLLRSPPASHIENPLNFMTLIYLPIASNDYGEEERKFLKKGYISSKDGHCLKNLLLRCCMTP